MRCKALAVSVALSAALATAPLTLAADNQPLPNIGTVTAAFGNAEVTGPSGKRHADLQCMLKNNDRITTDGGETSLLLASRVVLKVDANSSISIAETPGQTTILVDYGTVHIFVGQRPLNYGKVVVQDPLVRTDTLKGVYLVSYDRNTNSGYYACEHESLNVETIDGTHKIVLAGDTQAVMGKSGLQVTTLDRMAFDGRMKSLDQLGENMSEQQSLDFRTRSHQVDVQSEIATLQSLGFIKGLPSGAAQGQNAALAATAKTNKNGKSTVTQDSATPKAALSYPETPALSVNSNSNTNTPAAAPDAPAVVVNNPNNAAPVVPTAPPAAAAVVAPPVVVSAPPAIVPAAPPAAVVAPPVAPPPAAPVAPPVDVAPPVAVTPPIAPPPVVDVTPPAAPVAAPPVLAVTPPAAPVTPPIAVSVSAAAPPPVKVDPPVAIVPPTTPPPIAAPPPVAPPPVAPPPVTPPTIKVDPTPAPIIISVAPTPVIAPPPAPIVITPPVMTPPPIAPPPVVINPPTPVVVTPPPPAPVQINPTPVMTPPPPPVVVTPAPKVDAPPPVVPPPPPVPPVAVTK